MQKGALSALIQTLSSSISLPVRFTTYLKKLYEKSQSGEKSAKK
jgi:hypothetical protein